MPDVFGTPAKLIAGHTLTSPDPKLSALEALGEQWAAPRFAVGPHDHGPVWEVYLQHAGHADLGIGTQFSTRLGPGDGYLIPPHTRHSITPTGPAQLRFTYAIIDIAAIIHDGPGHLAPLADDLLAPPHNSRASTGPAEALRDPLRLLVGEALGTGRHRSAAIATALQALAVACARFHHHEPATRRQPGHGGIARALLLMESDPARPWPIADLAAAAGLSPNHFLRRFKAEHRTSPHKHLLALRLERARGQLGDTDATITAIAQACGFASSQHFATAFRQAHGTSPSHWRADHRHRANTPDTGIA